MKKIIETIVVDEGDDDVQVIHLQNVFRKSWPQLTRDLRKSLGDPEITIEAVQTMMVNENGFREWSWDSDDRYIFCDFDGMKIGTPRSVSA